MQMNLFNLHCRGATGYVAAGQISKKPRAFLWRHRISGRRLNISESWNKSMKDMKEKSRRDRDRRKRDPPIRGCRGLG